MACARAATRPDTDRQAGDRPALAFHLLLPAPPDQAAELVDHARCHPAGGRLLAMTVLPGCVAALSAGICRALAGCHGAGASAACRKLITWVSHAWGAVARPWVCPACGTTHTWTVAGDPAWMYRAAASSSGTAPAVISRTGRGARPGDGVPQRDRWPGVVSRSAVGT